MPDPSFEVHVDPAVHLAYPDYVALVLMASDVANGPSDAESDAQLAAAEAHVRASGLERAAELPHIAAWRAAFSAFGAKPSRYPGSAEALISRVLKGQPLNGLVAAAFLHRTSRAGDPQLHTHVVVANLVRAADGRWSALDGRLIYAHAHGRLPLPSAAARRADANPRRPVEDDQQGLSRDLRCAEQGPRGLLTAAFRD